MSLPLDYFYDVATAQLLKHVEGGGGCRNDRGISAEADKIGGAETVCPQVGVY